MDSLPVNGVDLIVLAVLAVSAVLAWGRGFVHEVLAIGGWIGAIFVTIYAFPYVRPFARQLIAIELLADIAAGMVIFVVSLGVFSIVTRALSRRVQDSVLNILDRSLGFLFGLARGVVLVGLAYIGLEWMMPPSEHPQWLRNARAMPAVEITADTLRSMVPGRAPSGRALVPPSVANGNILKDMLTVRPQNQDSGSSTSDGAYDRKERSELDRLIDRSQ
ncbi:MAG: CvpA family protein [Proteobacteria bacterium]|nr:CvpA family protein [Pseudomonadota bacterium]